MYPIYVYFPRNSEELDTVKAYILLVISLDVLVLRIVHTLDGNIVHQCGHQSLEMVNVIMLQ
jgi:hypothetical protein